MIRGVLFVVFCFFFVFFFFVFFLTKPMITVHGHDLFSSKFIISLFISTDHSIETCHRNHSVMNLTIHWSVFHFLQNETRDKSLNVSFNFKAATSKIYNLSDVQRV